MTEALLTPMGRAVPGLLLRHMLIARETERPDVGHRALPAPFSNWHDVVGIPVGAAAKEPLIALAELATFSPLLRGPCSLYPSPFHVEGHAELCCMDAAERKDAIVAAKHALTHQRWAVPGRP